MEFRNVVGNFPNSAKCESDPPPSSRIPTVPLGSASIASAYPNMSAVPVEEIVKDGTNVENILNPVKL